MKIEDLIKLLNDLAVDYALIGAQACGLHGFVRATKDIDILISPTPENIARVREALEKFGYDTTDASLEDFQTKKILFRQYWYDVDIHPSAKGVETKSVLKNKDSGIFEGVPTHMASIPDLIEMKKAAGRGRDLDDIHHLEEILRQKNLKK